MRTQHKIVSGTSCGPVA